MLKKAKRGIKSVTGILVSLVQKVLIKVLLAITYYIGFGITYIVVFIFNRELLKPADEDKETFWKYAEGYNPRMEECFRQS